MERYSLTVENGVLSIEGPNDALEIGAMDDVVDLIGGETYTIEYDSESAEMAAWLDLDDDQTLTFDVRETVTDMDFPEPFIKRLAAREESGSPSERTHYFASVMQDIWDQKGNLGDEDNPFV